MLVNLSGDLCLIFGLALLTLPLLAVELSRPRDGAWGALVLLLGMTLVTNRDRLAGSPTLGVLLATLLVAKLISEIALFRWNQLSDQEKARLKSANYWIMNLNQITKIIADVGSSLGKITSSLKFKNNSGVSGKKWVRQESHNNISDVHLGDKEKLEIDSSKSTTYVTKQKPKTDDNQPEKNTNTIEHEPKS